MFKSKQTKRNFIIAVIIALLVHLAVFLIFFTYKPEYDFDFSGFDDTDDLIMLPIIQDPPMPDPTNSEPEAEDKDDNPFTTQQQNQKKQLYNPYSQQEAEIMDGESVADGIKNQTDLEIHEPAAINPSDDPQEDFLDQSEAIELESFEQETDDKNSQEIESLETPESEDENKEAEIESDDEAQQNIQETGEQDTEFAQSDEEAPEEDGYQTQEDIVTEKDPNALRPIISQRSREKARAQLSNFAQGFNRQYQKIQDKKKQQNTGAARVRQQQSELQTMSYRQKVDQAIKEAAFYAQEIYSDLDIDHQVKVIITIDADGRVRNILFVRKTASATVNNFLENVIRSAKFSPLPQHLNLQKWEHAWQPMIRVRKGKNSLRYQYS